jgi:hypothetical protein
MAKRPNTIKESRAMETRISIRVKAREVRSAECGVRNPWSVVRGP